MRHIKTIQDVVDWGLCIGCGACYYACDKAAVTLVNVESVGIRPQFDSACASCTRCLLVCPGNTVDGNLTIGAVAKQTKADHEFGPSLEIWEGYSADPEIRFQASSGGLLSSIALYCLEKESMSFVLHTGMDREKPWLNRTVQSRNRAELLSRTASRYAPASPCDGLGAIEQSDGPCVFIGKPCDTAAASMARQQSPSLDRNLGLVLTFFCAGTPSTKGTLDLVKTLDVRLEDVKEVRYRGEGWPGRFKVRFGSPVQERSYTYGESWGRLTSYRPLRCHLCPDGLGRVADIACGDAWENLKEDSDPGRSIVIVRTRRGQDILHRAREAGYVELKPVEASAVFAAQPNLLERRREIFGRFLGMKILRTPTPRFQGFSLRRSWMRLPLWTQVRTVLGTARRILQRGQFRRKPVFSERAR